MHGRGRAIARSGPAFLPATPSFPGAASMPSASSDARATAVADRVMDALGGKEAWDATRYLRFGFGSERDGKFQGRTHTWDKWTGRYRVEGMTREGKPFLTLMNLNTQEGSAWLDGKKLEGAELKSAARARLRDVGERHLLAAHALQDEGPRRDPHLRRRREGRRAAPCTTR